MSIVINEDGLGIKFSDTFYRNFLVKKIKKDRDPNWSLGRCSSCGRTIKKGMRVIGDRWLSVCSNCIESWANKSEKTLKELIGAIRELKEYTKKNKTKWDKELLASNL